MQKVYAIVTILWMTSSAFALTCYNCNSVVDKRCLELTDHRDNHSFDDMLLDCDALAVKPPSDVGPDEPKKWVCRKVLLNLYAEGPRIFRNCSLAIDKHDKYYHEEPAFDITRCQCYSDRCNGTYPLSRRYLWPVILLTALVLLTSHFHCEVKA